MRVSDKNLTEKLQNQGLPVDEYSLLDSFAIDTSVKAERYAQILRDLPPGLSEWAVHPGLDNTDAREIDPTGWPVRHSDYEFVMSTEAQEIIEEEGIVLLNYKPLQRLWQGNL